MKTPKDHAEDVMRSVCAKHRIKLSELLSRRRFKEYTIARREVAHRLADEFPNWTVEHIGRVMQRDRTTVLYNLGRKKSRPLPNNEQRS